LQGEEEACEDDDVVGEAEAWWCPDEVEEAAEDNDIVEACEDEDEVAAEDKDDVDACADEDAEAADIKFYREAERDHPLETLGDFMCQFCETALFTVLESSDGVARVLLCYTCRAEYRLHASIYSGAIP
jgi:hypothetical protein